MNRKISLSSKDPNQAQLQALGDGGTMYRRSLDPESPRGSELATDQELLLGPFHDQILNVFRFQCDVFGVHRP